MVVPCCSLVTRSFAVGVASLARKTAARVKHKDISGWSQPVQQVVPRCQHLSSPPLGVNRRRRTTKNSSQQRILTHALGKRPERSHLDNASLDVSGVCMRPSVSDPILPKKKTPIYLNTRVVYVHVRTTFAYHSQSSQFFTAI